jgi:putative effector of murein hydrolase
MEYKGTEFLEKLFLKDSLFSPFISSIVGLIPNCGASVLITELYVNNAISFGALMSGLLTGSGVAILVLFKNNHNLKENFKILLIIYLIGSISGFIINLISLI